MFFCAEKKISSSTLRLLPMFFSDNSKINVYRNKNWDFKPKLSEMLTIFTNILIIYTEYILILFHNDLSVTLILLIST